MPWRFVLDVDLSQRYIRVVDGTRLLVSPRGRIDVEAGKKDPNPIPIPKSRGVRSRRHDVERRALQPTVSTSTFVVPSARHLWLPPGLVQLDYVLYSFVDL